MSYCGLCNNHNVTFTKIEGPNEVKARGGKFTQTGKEWENQ
jgi:hypothetical protein